MYRVFCVGESSEHQWFLLPGNKSDGSVFMRNSLSLSVWPQWLFFPPSHTEARQAQLMSVVMVEKLRATQNMELRCVELGLSLFLCSGNTAERCSVPLTAWIPPSLSLSLLHPRLHSFPPWEPIDRLQQPFNEISPVPLEKRSVQSNR